MDTAVAIEKALSAENRSVEVDGETLVYRSFGNAETEAPPLLCLQHFRGNLDDWDPALIDRIAREREVILLDNRGVGASSGAVPDNVSDMARDVLRFFDALELREIDVLGFSLGGYVAQKLALVRPRLIRRSSSPLARHRRSQDPPLVGRRLRARYAGCTRRRRVHQALFLGFGGERPLSALRPGRRVSAGLG